MRPEIINLAEYKKSKEPVWGEVFIPLSEEKVEAAQKELNCMVAAFVDGYELKDLWEDGGEI